MCRRGELQIALCCCVRFSLNSPTFQIRPHFKFAPITNRLHVEGLIAISPYTGVIRTFASIRVNTQKRRHGLGMRAFACVVGANWNSPTFQIRHVTIRPYCNSPYAVACVFPSIRPCYKLPTFQIRPCFQLPPFQIALRIKNSKKVFYYKNKFVSLPPWKKYMSCNTHSW